MLPVPEGARFACAIQRREKARGVSASGHRVNATVVQTAIASLASLRVGCDMLGEKRHRHLSYLLMHRRPIDGIVIDTDRGVHRLPMRGGLTEEGVMADVPRQDGEGGPWNQPREARRIGGRGSDPVGRTRNDLHRDGDLA